uniref:Potassium channel domain-containing protein n=1 Tax=Meloidogyne javanica TaxID=6303 RepID=A0A915MF91_MELJA
MLEVRCENGLEDTDKALQNRHVKEHLFWLMDYLNLTQVIEERSENSPWTWMGAMFYAGQLYTTIGYGLPATQTSGGRLASIIYIMIGIPLFLIILAEVGKLLSRGLRKLYKKMHKMKRIPEAARKMSEPMKAIYHMTTSLASTAVGPLALQILNANNEEEKLEAKRKAEIKALAKASKGEKKSFPIPWALTILIVWILFSAALFCIWESEWGYINSVYFFFVSISTVGLGDLVPTKPDMMIVNFFMILIGLALLSMCVNLIQEALQKLIERLIEQYIDEIEKIAAVVTNNEINEFTEELEPFNVGEINEISLPIATLNIEQPRIVVENGGGIGRTVKDWFAEKASNSTPTREGISSQKRHKKPPKLPKDYAGALLKFSAPTMQAIRAIESYRLKNGQIGNDFKSRLFAAFATNQRFAEIVENNAPPPKKMVSSSIQTSPRQSPIHSIPQKSWKLRRLGCGIESLDSTSSDLNVTRTTTNDASNPSCSANDLDSLYSNTYFDVCFGNYHTDSVPSLMAITPLLPQSSSQIAMANSKKLGERRSSLALKRRFSDKLFFGLFGRHMAINRKFKLGMTPSPSPAERISNFKQGR